MPTLNSHIRLAYGKQRHAALTNKKQENYDQMHTDNIVKQSQFHIYRKKYKNIFFS